MEPVPEDWERALAVAAHPDDLEYGTAAAVARWTGEGRSVSYLMVTRGEAGISGMPPEQTGPLRMEEERRSAAVVGVDRVMFLDGYADGLVEYGLPLRRDLAGVLRQVRPDLVLTGGFDLTWGETSNVNHADHRAVGLAVLDACRDAANPWLFPEAGEAWTGIKHVLVAGDSQPTHYADVTGAMDAGVASLREHKVYIEGLGREFDPDTFLRDMAGFVGLGAGVEYAVAFRKYSSG
jgi:LmbE family N-acetylglucosaminyl deacetylase